MDGARIQNFTSVCRLCLSEDESFISIFDENYRSLPQRIADCVNVQVQESDKVTTMICKGCLMKIEEWYDFKKCCEDSQSKLKTWINCNDKSDFADIHIKEETHSSIDDPMQILETSMCIKSEPIDSVYLPESEDDDMERGDLSPASSLSVSAVEQMDSLLVPALECPAAAHGINAPFYSNMRINDLGTKCRVCSKTFSNVHNRFRHERTLHNLEREVPVSHFMSSSDRSEECVTDHSEASSNVTLEQFAASLQLVQRNSVRPVSEKQFIEFNKKMHNMMVSGTCECCNMMYSSTDALFDHLSKQMNIEPFTCFLCCITFPNEAQYMDHAQQNFCEQRASLIDRDDCRFKVYQHYECVECKVFYVHELFLAKHLHAKHAPDAFPAACARCAASFDARTDFEQHMLGPCFCKLYCSICKLYFGTLADFDKHSKVHDDASSARAANAQAAAPAGDAEGSSPLGRKPNDVILMDRSTKCQLCGKQYSNFHNLLRHIKINHKNKLINCLFCTKKFLIKDDFRTHILNEHKSLVKATKQGDVYMCEQCDEQSATMDEWCDHQHNHSAKSSLTCDECDQTFETDNDLDMHKSTHANLKLKLYRCSDSNSYKTTNDFAMQQFSPTFMCDLCDKYFTDEEDLSAHRAMHADPLPGNPAAADHKENDLLRRFNCPFCKKSYSCYSSMWKHKKKHHGKNSRQFLRMVSTKHFGKKRICPICYKVVPNSKALWYHKKKMHGLKPKNRLIEEEQSMGVEPVKVEIVENGDNVERLENTCEVCNKSFGSLKGLSIHARQHTQQIKTEGVKKCKCSLCPKEFVSSELLENHMKSHSNKTFMCPVCEKHFMNNAGLASHVRIHSNKSAPAAPPPPPPVKLETDEFKCTVCSVVLSNRSALSNHVKVHLRDNSSHVCTICQRKFSGGITLLNHMRYVHGENEEQAAASGGGGEPGPATSSERYPCTICDRSFLREGLLKNHLKAHEMNHAKNRVHKKYKCNQCKKTLPSAQALVRHQKEHDFTKLSCNECNRKFHSAGALASHKGWHLRNVCNVCNMYFESKGEFVAHVQSHKQKQHCLYCGRSFFSVGALKKHVALIHGKESIKLKKKLGHADFKPAHVADRTYKCTECNAIFVNAKKLRLHVSMHSVHV